jgi:hypothetical protein
MGFIGSRLFRVKTDYSTVFKRFLRSKLVRKEKDNEEKTAAFMEFSKIGRAAIKWEQINSDNSGSPLLKCFTEVE